MVTMSLGNKQMNNQVIPKSQEKSNLEILKEKANAEGATEADILRSALADSQERYNKQADNIAKKLDEYDKRIQKLEKSIEQSNKQKTVDVSKALEDAAKTVLQNIQDKVTGYSKEIEKATDKLRVAREEKSADDEREGITFIAKILGGLVIASTIGGYIANYVWGKWYHLPQALKELDKLQPINDALYQIGKQLGL